MSDLCSTLLGLLERQSAGDGSAPSRIADISAQLSGERVFRDPLLTPQQVRAVELLLSEWSEMFSFEPGRPEGLPPLISLLNEVCRNRRLEQMEIYEREEWKKIVALRGPVETVQVCECANCRRQYPRMGMSGFLDLVALVCGRCGAVVFESIYEEEREAACPCGGVAKLGCPSCGSLQARVIEEMSPYRYFSDHTFYREEAS
jgi:hypothetical protein